MVKNEINSLYIFMKKKKVFILHEWPFREKAGAVVSLFCKKIFFF